MNVTCPDCSSIFRVDPAKVPAAGVQARCSVCGGVMAVSSVRTASEPRPPDASFTAAGDGETIARAVAPTVLTQSEAPHEASASVEPAPPAAALGSSTASHPSLPDAPSLGAPAVELPPAPRTGRPVNPYLNNTPELRARRLARALVSDLVAYNPQKREQGLRDGTLRQLFRDEIRKSWDEYVEQVGANVAESTPHFQDALNDVLAGGRRVF